MTMWGAREIIVYTVYIYIYIYTYDQTAITE